MDDDEADGGAEEKAERSACGGHAFVGSESMGLNRIEKYSGPRRDSP